MKSIFILTGKVHSGKTTRLQSWLTDKKDVQGILSPVKNEKRYLLDINTNEKRMIEIDSISKSENFINIGNYKFDKTILDWGCEIILTSINKNPSWLIIDEIGPLELKGEGFARAVNKVFSDEKLLTKTNVVLVIRDSLINDFIIHYNLDKDDVNYLNILD